MSLPAARRSAWDICVALASVSSATLPKFWPPRPSELLLAGPASRKELNNGGKPCSQHETNAGHYGQTKQVCTSFQCSQTLQMNSIDKIASEACQRGCQAVSERQHSSKLRFGESAGMPQCSSPGPTSHGRRAAAGTRRRPLTRMRELCAHSVQHNDALRLRKLHHLRRHWLRCARALSHCHPRARAHQRAFKCSLQLLHTKPHALNTVSALRMHARTASPAGHRLCIANALSHCHSRAWSMSYLCGPFTRAAMGMRTLCHWALIPHMLESACMNAVMVRVPLRRLAHCMRADHTSCLGGCTGSACLAAPQQLGIAAGELCPEHPALLLIGTGTVEAQQVRPHLHPQFRLAALHAHQPASVISEHPDKTNSCHAWMASIL